MNKSRLLGAAYVGVILFIPNFASAAIISLHSGDTNPLTEGWTEATGPGVTVGAVNDGGTFAWKVDDNSTGSTTTYQYIDSVSAQDALDASTLGWALSLDLRVVDVPDTVDFAVYAEYSTGTNRYLMNFGSDADGDPIVQLSGGLNLGATYTLEGVGSTYHSYSLVFDPISGSADLFVDGVERLSDFTGFAGTVGPRVAWGSGQGTVVGQGNYASVQFSVVPIPAAAWLFGSGLLGLVGIARRKIS